MSMNLIQFQPGLSMPEFLRKYGTESRCRRALYRARWPMGFRCPACGDRRRSSFRRGAQTIYQCRACQHQSTLISGTLLQDTKLPLTTWFLAIHLLTSTKTNMAALELKRHLGISYRAAWRLKHKVMQAMTEREAPRKLNGFVQIDDAYLGGERNGGKPRRDSENKLAFLIAVETDAELEHPACVVIEPVRTFDNTALTDWAERRLAPDAEAYTGHAHTVLETGGGRAATEIPRAGWVNAVLANVKRAISGVYHAIRQAKYARRCLADATFRFNRRFRLAEMTPRHAHAIMACKPCPEPSLHLTCDYSH